MTRTALPYSAPDLSALARRLERALLDHQLTHGCLPGHVEMMNLLARGAGYRNLQALQAASSRPSAVAPAALAADEPDAWFDAPLVDGPDGLPAPAAATLSARVKKALAHFDTAGRLERWPLKLSVQRLAMWVLWTRFDARRIYSESEVNRILKAWHLYGDHATLRRELINHRLMTRKDDCSAYRKLPVEPDDEARSLLRALRASRVNGSRRPGARAAQRVGAANAPRLGAAGAPRLGAPGVQGVGAAAALRLGAAGGPRLDAASPV